MIDVHELLRKKENDIDRVRKEIHALQLVAPLLSDSEEPRAVPTTNSHLDAETTEVLDDTASDTPSDQSFDEAEHAEASSDPIPPKRGILRDWFNRAAGE